MTFEIDFKYYEDGNIYVASFINPILKGLVETGKTQKEAFEELITSLKVIIAYENNINL